MASISEKIQDALNGQINAEMYSAHLYMAMAAYFESLDLPGFGHWMRTQSTEEQLHVDKLFSYIVDRGGRVILSGVESPPVEWESPLATFEAAFAHEQEISEKIDTLVGLAHSEKDRATENLLRWYVDEQVEEEASADRVVKMLRIGEGQAVALLMLDRELAGRESSDAPQAE